MPEILRNGQVQNDNWQVLRMETLDALDAPAEGTLDLSAVNVPTGQWLVPFSVWLAQRNSLATRKDVAVWLSPEDDLTEVAKHFDQWPLLAIDFPKFTDGRGYSMAWRLRNHYHYSGELRAIGNVLVDQLFFMLRVGFDTLALDPKVSAATAERSLAPFPDAYQGSTDNPAPIFRRIAR